MSVAVIVDDREPVAVVTALRAHPDVELVTVDRLDAGDLVVRGVGFERKTPADYVRSAMGRDGVDLDAQVRAMNAAYDHAYVLLEGELTDAEAVWPEAPDAALRGSVASVTARLRAPVVPCGDLERLVDVAVRLGRKHTESRSPRSLPPGAVPSPTEPVAKRMYACIDGVGPTTSQALYEAFPTVASLLSATQEDLLAVEGVGPKRARAVYEALRTEE